MLMHAGVFDEMGIVREGVNEASWQSTVNGENDRLIRVRRVVLQMTVMREET